MIAVQQWGEQARIRGNWVVDAEHCVQVGGEMKQGDARHSGHGQGARFGDPPLPEGVGEPLTGQICGRDRDRRQERRSGSPGSNESVENHGTARPESRADSAEASAAAGASAATIALGKGRNCKAVTPAARISAAPVAPTAVGPEPTLVAPTVHRPTSDATTTSVQSRAPPRRSGATTMVVPKRPATTVCLGLCLGPCSSVAARVPSCRSLRCPKDPAAVSLPDAPLRQARHDSDDARSARGPRHWAARTASPTNVRLNAGRERDNALPSMPWRPMPSRRG